MAEVLQDSPYANKLPRPYNQVQDGLGYSRHYAQRIRDMGKNSKDTWIKKLWNHMFQSRQNRGNAPNRERDPYFGQETYRTKSRAAQYSRGDGDSVSPAVPRKSKQHPSDKSDHKSTNERKQDEFHLRRGKTFDEREMKRAHRKSEDTNNLSSGGSPNLPPIASGSHMVSSQRQQNEHQFDTGRVKTKTAPSAAFIKTAVSTLYSNSDENIGDEQIRRKPHTPLVESEEEVISSSPSHRRSRSVKQNAFMREKTIINLQQPHPPPVMQPTVIYPKSTKSADQRYEQSRISTNSNNKHTPAATAVTTYPTHHKPKYDTVIQGKEKNLETRSPTRGDSSNKHLSKYERKLKRLQDRYDGNRYMKPQKSHPYLESKSFLNRGSTGEDGKGGQRNPQVVELEKKAKALTEKAMKDNKVFSVDGPYPVDTYVRISLRRRGWVEKFGSKGNNASQKVAYSGRADTETEEDFDAICGQEVPAPWEEENGLYAIASRLVRHFPAKFIWGGKNVNSMVLRSEVITNHFPKARYFSSKTGLTTSLRELIWINSGDSSNFFPRCYTLCSDEQDDIVEDFRLTSCMGLLKWVLKMYVSKKHRDKFREMLVRRENTKYEEVKFDCSGEEDNGEAVITEEEEEEEEREEEDGAESEKEDEEVDENDEEWEDVEDPDDQTTNPGHERARASARGKRSKAGKHGKSRSHSRATSRKSQRAAPPPKAQPDINFDYFDEDYESDFEEADGPESPKDQTNNGSNDVEKSQDTTPRPKKAESGNTGSKGEPRERHSKKSKTTSHKKHGAGKKTGHLTPKGGGLKPGAPLSRSHTTLTPRTTPPPSSSRLPNIRPGMPSRSNTVATIPLAKPKGQVLPDLKKEKQSKKGGEVPLKAVDWAIYVLDKYIKCKNHHDIDNKSKNLTASQWSQLLKWYHQIAHEGATVPNMTEGKLKESDSLLKQMKKLWPQYDIDGKRNMWIVKPGDKSKGIGIEFASKLDEILKYVNNATTAGTYIVQKYIERPLLLCNCKFDLRQWFIVTEWAPLTVWFYGECYLRICSQQYSVDTMHEAVHLSNVSVQQNYLNGKRDSKLPDNNFMTSTQFIKYLDEEGKGYIWKKIVVPGMKEAIVNTLVATQDVAESRKNAFELYGADFILTEDYRPYLLEINSSPGMAPSSVEKARLCATVIDDTIKVVLDKKENKSAETGGFELIYKDNNMGGPTKCVDTKFIVEGQKVRKSELAKYTQIDQEETKKYQQQQQQQISKNLEHYIREKSNVSSSHKTKKVPPKKKAKPLLPAIKVTVNRCESPSLIPEISPKSPTDQLSTTEENRPVSYPIDLPEDLSDAISLTSLDHSEPHETTTTVNPAEKTSPQTATSTTNHPENCPPESNKNVTTNSTSAPTTQRTSRFLISPGRVSSRKPKTETHYSGNPYHDRHGSAQPQKYDGVGGFVKLRRGKAGAMSSRRRSALLTEERIREKERIYSSMLTARFFNSHDVI